MKNHENQPETMKNHSGTMKTDQEPLKPTRNLEKPWKLSLNHKKTTWNREKPTWNNEKPTWNHEKPRKPIWNHEKPTWNPEKPWKQTWNHENPFQNHSRPFVNFADHPGRKLSRNMRKNFLDMQKLPGWQCHDETMVFGPLLIGLEMRECLWSCCSNQNAFIFNVDFEDMCDLKKWRRWVVDQIYIGRDGLIKHKLPRELQTKAWIAWCRILK